VEANARALGRFVDCQKCGVGMDRLPARRDPGPAEWQPSDERLSALFSEVFHCPVCGRVAIRPGAVAAAAKRAVA
jgi:predicted RNA-binding Zn-ribbon protein involved in translation (DUF1610 family)